MILESSDDFFSRDGIAIMVARLNLTLQMATTSFFLFDFYAVSFLFVKFFIFVLLFSFPSLLLYLFEFFLDSVHGIS